MKTSQYQVQVVFNLLVDADKLSSARKAGSAITKHIRSCPPPLPEGVVKVEITGGVSEFRHIKRLIVDSKAQK